MAIIYGKNTAVDYAAGNLASFGKSYSRMGAAPLDMYEVWYDYAELVKYASFRGNDANGNPVYDGDTEVTDTSAVTSYVGQKVAYVNETEGKIYHYSIELNGSLKEIGTSPVGDEKSIVVDTNGTVSLKGVDALVFERDIIGEDGQPTGQKENVQFQPLMTKDGLIWVEPSKTTVEGLASLIDGLTARVSALENDRVTEQELADAVKVETDRATAAEEALGQRIDAIDFVDADELATAISGVEAKIPTNNNQLENGAGYQTADDVSAAITTGIANKADKADTLAGYGITDAYTKTEVDTELAKKAAADDLTALKNRVDAFLTGEGTEAALDSLQELIEYINTHDNTDLSGILSSIQALENKVDTGDQKVSEYVTAAIDALKIGDYAKAADLTTLAGRVKTLEDKPFDTYATKSEVEAVDDKFAGKLDVATYNADKDTFAVAETVNADLAKKVDKETYEADKATFAVATEVAVTYATKAELAPVTQTANNAATKADSLESRLNGLVAQGGEPNTINTIKVNGTALTVDEQKAVDITVPTALTSLSGYTELNALAQKGVDDAAAVALSVTNLTNGQVAQNKNEIAAIKNIINGEDNENSYAKRLAALEAHDLAHGEEYTALNTKVGENTTAIAKKADADNVYTKGEADALINTKANTADVYTKGEVDTKVQAAIDAIPEVDFKPYAKVTDVEAIFKAGEGENPATGILAEEIARAKAAEEANANAISAIVGEDSGKTIRAIATEEAKAEVATLVGEAPEALDTIHEIASWIKNDETGAAAMSAEIAEHSGILSGFGGEGQPSTVLAAIATAKQEAIDAIPALAIATADVLGGVKSSTVENKVAVGADGTMEVNSMNVNKLTQTEGDTLVLNGGNAGVAAAE